MAFWKKIFKSKYTGAEIDAAVAAASKLPSTEEAKTYNIIEYYNNKWRLAPGFSLGFNSSSPYRDITYGLEPMINDNHLDYWTTKLAVTQYVVPESVQTKINTMLMSIYTTVLTDYKMHSTTASVTNEDANFEDFQNFANVLEKMVGYKERPVIIINEANLGNTFLREGISTGYGMFGGITYMTNMYGELYIEAGYVSDSEISIKIHCRRIES